MYVYSGLLEYLYLFAVRISVLIYCENIWLFKCARRRFGLELRQGNPKRKYVRPIWFEINFLMRTFCFFIRLVSDLFCLLKSWSVSFYLFDRGNAVSTARFCFVVLYLRFCILWNAFFRIFQTTLMVFNKKSSTDSVPLYWDTEFSRDSIAFWIKNGLIIFSINLSDFCASYRVSSVYWDFVSENS